MKNLQNHAKGFEIHFLRAIKMAIFFSFSLHCSHFYTNARLFPKFQRTEPKFLIHDVVFARGFAFIL